ncbi:MAG: endonuclease MutS2 [Anaerovoracaceae bacterium]
MNDKSLRVLEYDKILVFWANQAGSDLAREKILKYKPLVDYFKVKAALSETSEAVSLIENKGSLPLGNFYNISNSIILAAKGGALSIRQLLHVLYNMTVARNVSSFMNSDIPVLTIVKGMTDALAINKELEDKIDSSILSEEEISDNASPELKSIRRGMGRQNEAIKNKLNQLINSSDNRTYLQDAIVTIRAGRYVIPVKQEYRARFPGIVHDQSSSGATVFVEPQAIVNLNNKLRELEAAEKIEIDRILRELSAEVGEFAEALKYNQELLLSLDFIMAKGKLSREMKAEPAEINEDGFVDLKKARHPLIDKSKVIPINVYVGGDFNALIVTGPNTGGKTVTLKTVGLLSLMSQSGLHIPAWPGSKLPIFDNVFADIGDEQSIEQNLSTFSSHMTNIVQIVNNADEGSLVLFDELGAGTDPTEGAALAIAILEKIIEKDSRVIATTHYTELKKFALSAENVENASMEFDIETLSPTYKLAVGVPGKSNAFEISKKLGLPNELIEHSKRLLDAGALEFEDLVSSIENDRNKTEEEREKAESASREIKKRLDEIKNEEKRLKKENEAIINKAKAEARDIVKEAKNFTKEIQKELREITKIESLGERNKRLDKNRHRIKDRAGRYKEQIELEQNEDPLSIDDVEIGHLVKIVSMNQTGDVIGLPDKNEDLLIQLGSMKMKVNAKDLQLINNGKVKRTPTGVARYSNILRSKAKTVSPMIDLHGKNLDEALLELDKYLDDVAMSGLHEVTINHGVGTGVLKNGIRKELKTHPHIKSFRRGEFNEGGDGCTLVRIK